MSTLGPMISLIFVNELTKSFASCVTFKKDGVNLKLTISKFFPGNLDQNCNTVD